MSDNKRIDILFYVQHLLGIGHQRRAATLTRALERAGLTVAFVSGGMEVPGLDTGTADFYQLDPVKADGIYFTELQDQQGKAITADFRKQRCEQLLGILDKTCPRLILLEMFPFGRRQMRFELLPLLKAATAMTGQPKIVSSVRDILVKAPKKERISEMLDWVKLYFDQVIIHGDPALIPFDRTFAPARSIIDKIRYSGYVVDEQVDGPPHPVDGKDEILVSTGGGAVSERLLDAALAARALSPLKNKVWRLLIGHSLPEEKFARYSAQAEDKLIIQRSRPDFTSLLPNCMLSISQGGYNTVMEVLRAGCPRVIVPYSGGLETEQTLRAQLLSEKNALTVVDETNLTGEILARAMESTLRQKQLSPSQLNTAGAENTVNLLKNLLEKTP
ncbi:glycosyltransferase [Kiloniella laminariae]|uniref:Glycosyltransferase n=1 Tax=Kiloniella laminariae TaxID=454162 RepID=A0ABT4LJ70_9PROT|nr:glycosyltransferase [Kiloniella laminariae]MCZ4281148.1 glycosyltransferase [Kiloniella laminariae]